jgi:hypothetical protein
MLVLLVLAAIFWRERAWFIDIAFQTVLMIRDGTLQVQVYRWGSAAVQVLPLLAIKLELPLGWVSWLYSVGIHGLFLLFFGLTTYALRRSDLGLGIALLYTLMVFDGFYWVTSELQQGLGLAFVQFAFWLRYPRLDRWWQWLVQIPLVVLLGFYHPLIFLVYLFGAVYLAWSRPELRHLRFAVAALLMVLVTAIKSRYFGNWYDDYRFEQFWNAATTHWPDYFQFRAWSDFFGYLITVWWGLLVAWLVVFGGLLYRRRWVSLLLVGGATFAFLVISAIQSPEIRHRFYAEVNFYPLAVFVILPFCLDLLPQWRDQYPRLVISALGLFLFLRLFGIQQAHEPFTERRHWLAVRIEEGRRHFPTTNRYYYRDTPALEDTLIMTWGAPFETLLLTATTEGPDRAATLYLLGDNEEKQRASLQQPDRLVGRFFDIKITDLDGVYFHLGEKPYRLLPSSPPLPEE